MNDLKPNGSVASARKAGSALTWVVLGVVVTLSLGRLIYSWAAPHFDRATSETIIPRGRLSESHSSAKGEDTLISQGSTAEDGSCPVPGLPEGPARVDIELKLDIPTESVGGTIEKGRYRIVGAYAKNEGFTPGRWSMTFDLGEAGQGAFYRQLGFNGLSTRIRWSARNGVFSYETVCPDSGESMRFPYSVHAGKLFMTASDGIVLVLEPYAPSEVSKLSPLL